MAGRAGFSWLSPEGTFDYAPFLTVVTGAGRTENGVFAARVMWNLDELLEKLGRNLILGFLAGRDLDLLTRGFGPLRFVYLRRRDALAQAVSWLRAEQTNRLALGIYLDPPVDPDRDPWYDGDRIRSLLQLIETHNVRGGHGSPRSGRGPRRDLRGPRHLIVSSAAFSTICRSSYPRDVGSCLATTMAA